MTRRELKDLLKDQTNEEFVDHHIFNRRPWIFSSGHEYDIWCHSVAAALGVQINGICIVGSAATGYSLSPFKAGRAFRAQGSQEMASDIDVAFTSATLFEEAWNTIVALDRRRGLRMSKDERTKLRIDVYWGAVAQRSIPSNTDLARRVLTAVAAATRIPPIRGYILRSRIYRRIEDLRAYHVDSLRQLRTELET
jgi:hypothetical protein